MSAPHGAESARFARRVLHYLLVVGLLSLVARPVAAVVALLWGFSLAGELLRRFAEPALQRRIVEREAGRALERELPEARRGLEQSHARELGARFAELADGIRGPLRAAQGLVRQMGEDPAAPANVDHARLALRELDRVERSIAHLLRTARESRAARAHERSGAAGGAPA